MVTSHIHLKKRLGRKNPSLLESVITVSGPEKGNRFFLKTEKKFEKFQQYS